MSIWDEEWENYEDDKHDFEAWLDSLEGINTILKHGWIL